MSADSEPRELCDLCQISSPSMTGVLKRMEELDLIRRCDVKGDQRRVLIGLSEQGDALMLKIAPLIDVQYQYIEQAFGSEAIDELIAALERFNEVRTEAVEQVKLD
jgi:DNA-binding MarR family transcriptional regulator